MRDLPNIIFRDNWIEKKLARKEDSKEEITRKKTFFLFLAPGFPTLILVGSILWLLEIRNYAYTMFIFTLFELLLLSTFIVIRKNTMLFALINQYFFVFFSFACVLVFGGIINSGGVVLVGLAGVLNSVTFLKPAQTKTLLIVYLFTILTEVLLDPYLKPLPEITPLVNLILFALHLLVIVFALFTVLSFYFEQSSRIKKMEAEHLKELDTVKTQFYTNITHEFRTPLTVILGLSDNLQLLTKESYIKNMKLIRQNGIHLLQLVTRMLDLSKLEANAMKMIPIQTDIFSFVKSFIEPYEYLAKEKNIQLIFQHQPEKLVMDFDQEKIESLIGNLLSNSIKFANPDSKIHFSAILSSSNHETVDYGFSPIKVRPISTSHSVQLQIKDEGRGIDPVHLPHIFDRFYQEEEISTSTPGSGIGLLLVKELVNLMKGNLFVKSEPGKGTEFTIFLPVANTAPVVKKKIPNLTSDMPEQKTDNSEKKSVKNKPKILIVEDNNDLVYFLYSLLENDFLLERAVNGQLGVETAFKIIPDLVISDIMMPEMDGYELCKTLKNDFRTSHIPIIILTAKADFESRISGYKTGADAYLSKPFEQQELRTVINNLIVNRLKLEEKFRTLAVLPDKSEIAPSNPDETFLKKLREVMSSNYSEDRFGTVQLTHEMGMSRVQLFRKLKALTGLSASHFMRLYRLTMAKEKIEKTGQSISEIAYESGFSDPTYFTHAFNKEFGYSPTKARENTRD